MHAVPEKAWEEVKHKNRKASVVFVDFRKAFDSVNREKMIKILKAYGIPANIITAIKVMYENTKARVITPDGETELFDILTGVLQGDTLAPFLFAIVVDYIMRQTIGEDAESLGFKIERRRSRRIGPQIVSDLDFADDIALLSEEISSAQRFLYNLENEANKVGLHLNNSKTEVMIFNQEYDTPIRTKTGHELKQVTNFKYLGGQMESSDKDWNYRKGMAWSALNKMSKIWKSNISQTMKRRVFSAAIESILLYNTETYTVNKAFNKKLSGTHSKMLRAALNIKWQQRISNDQIYENLLSGANIVRKRRMTLAGHCLRHPEGIASQLVLWKSKEGNPSRDVHEPHSWILCYRG